MNPEIRYRLFYLLVTRWWNITKTGYLFYNTIVFENDVFRKTLILNHTMKVKLFTPFLEYSWSCCSFLSKLTNSSTNPVINQLKNDLKLEQFTNKNISENLVVNWNIFQIRKRFWNISDWNYKRMKLLFKIFSRKLKIWLIAIKKELFSISYFLVSTMIYLRELFTIR
jgi:hypothetical protein